MKNKCRELMLQGGQAIGTFFEIGGSNAVECLGLAGLDFLIIDTEHGQFDVESTAEYVRAANLRDITPFVRIKDCTRPSVLKMLDIGAQGLIAPNVTSVDEVKSLVEYAKYYPVGQRGVYFGRESGWGTADYASSGLDVYFETCNRESLLIPQCETRGCLDHIEEITAIPGVDGIFIGPFDLSVALGKPGDFETAEFQQAIDRILKACKNAGKFASVFTMDPEAAKSYFKQGFDAACVALDTLYYINSYKQLVKQIRE